MSRSIKITAYCDGRPLVHGVPTPCSKSLHARSHKKLTEKLQRLGWVELPDSILKCQSCLARVSRGENVQFVKKVG